MTTFRTILFLAVLVSGRSLGAAAPSTRTQIDGQYKRWVAASLRLDVDGVLAILAPDYSLQTFDGKLIPRQMYEKSLRARKAKGQRPASYKTSIESLSQTGDTASVISLETSITDTPDPVTQKVQKVIHIHQYRDTWNHLEGAWKLSSTVTLLEKTTVALNPKKLSTMK